MINHKEILEQFIKFPTKNSFVSKAILFDNHKEINVKKIHKTDKSEIRELLHSIELADKQRLTVIAAKHTSIIDFLNDREINPDPSYSPLKKVSKQITFTIECLPIKSQNPLKCSSFKPDLGELTFLIHLNNIAEVCKNEYSTKVNFKLLLEASIYQDLFEDDISLGKIFTDNLKQMCDEYLNIPNIDFIDWFTICNELPKFLKVFQEQKHSTFSKYLENEQSIITAVNKILPTIYMSLKNTDLLVYKPESLTEPIIKHIEKAIKISCNILAFKLTRELLQERLVLFPNDTRGTLTPAPNKQSFYPIGKWNKLYPHHGLGIVNLRTKKVRTEYIDNLTFSDKAESLVYYDLQN